MTGLPGLPVIPPSLLLRRHRAVTTSSKRGRDRQLPPHGPLGSQGTYRPRPAYRFTVEDSIYVDPGHAGKGCGRALLAGLIEDCERGPWRQMIAVIGDSANTASIRLHRHFQFRSAGTLLAVGFKFNQWVDTVLMQRELG